MKRLFYFFIALTLVIISSLTLKGQSNLTSKEEVNYIITSNSKNNNDIIYDNEKSKKAIERCNTNKKLLISKEDIYLMAQIVYGESIGEPFEGKVGVASVILNRVLSPDFPDTVHDVIFQPSAFSCIIDDEISCLPTQDCFNAVYEAINGYNPIGDALFFFNPDIATCDWMHDSQKVNSTSIGQHIFFNL